MTDDILKSILRGVFLGVLVFIVLKAGGIL
jgi:hypothetical protein